MIYDNVIFFSRVPFVLQRPNKYNNHMNMAITWIPFVFRKHFKCRFFQLIESTDMAVPSHSSYHARQVKN